jgi:lysozyme
MIPYTDLSYANTKVDYKAMKAAGISLVYTRLAQAGLGLDPEFLIHQTGAASVGLPFGGYFFYDYFHYTPAKNADFCFQYMKQVGNIGEAPLGLDIEEEARLGWGPLTSEQALVYALAFYNELGILLGKSVDEDLYYGNPNLIGPMAKLNGINVLMKHPLWIAHWDASFPTIAPWPTWKLWQNKGDIRVPWASQPVDFGWFNGNASDLAEWLAKPPVPPIPPLPSDALQRLWNYAIGQGWKL